MRWHRVTEAALLVETGDPWRSLALADVAWARHWAVEVVPAAETVFLDGVERIYEVVAWLETAALPSEPPEGPELEIPVVYDGEDLNAVADLWSVSAAEVVARHTALEWIALFSGFAPGFSYLAPSGAWPTLPRRETPRAKVPAGSVALADGWSGIYPTPSPGGWQLLGHTEVVLWDVLCESPALITPGTRVRFVAR